MLKTLFSKKLPSTMEAVGKTVNEAVDVLCSHEWCKDDTAQFSLRLCLEEALVNAMVHGNANEAARHVQIEIAEEGERCHVRVSDEGKGFDPQAIEMPDCNQLGGRGVCLIKHFMDDVRFDRAKHCLEMTFRRGSLTREEESHAT
jgi:serine/threonine-protein kinase RsbW